MSTPAPGKLKFTARLSVSMDFEAPCCGSYLDLFDIDYMNDDQYLWIFLTGSRYRYDKDGWKNINHEFDCPKCGKEIIFNRRTHHKSRRA